MIVYAQNLFMTECLYKVRVLRAGRNTRGAG